MCSPAPVVDRFGRDVESRFGIPTVYNQPGPGGVFLGSVGDQAHSTRRSSHNCAGAPGGQESPVNGVAYAPQYAHAWDCRPATKRIGEEMAAATLADPRCRYVIFDNVGRYPDGDTWRTSHPTWHVSFLPGTHDDTRPFFDQQGDLTVADVRELLDAHQDTRALILTLAEKEARREARLLAYLKKVRKAQGATDAELDEIQADIEAVLAELRD